MRIIVFVSIAFLLGFILGRCSRSSPEVVYETIKVVDTLKFVDTVRVLDTVFISSMGEIRLVGCDTASFSWNFNTSHVFRMERGTFLEKGITFQGERLSHFGVGVGIGWYGVFFPYITVRYKNLTGWIKPIRPWAGGVSIQLLAF